MSQKKEIMLNAIAFVLAVSLIAGLIVLLNQINKTTLSTNTPPVDSKPIFKTTNTTNVNPKILARDRISFGEKILAKKEESSSENQEFQAAKQRGASAIAEKKYEQAAKDFEEAIQKYRNAPETLIYLNNARIGNKQAYTIAAAVPIGTEPEIALAILRGVAQAQNEFNQAGGMNGMLLKVAIANDDNNPEIARQVASELVNIPEVLTVIGHYSSDATLKSAEIYSSEKLVAIAPTSTSIKLSGFSPYIFRTPPSDYVCARALAEYMLTKKQWKKAAVFFNPSNAQSQSLKSEFLTAVSLMGGQVVAEFDLAAPGFSALKSVEDAIAKGAEVLMLASTQDTIDKTLQVVVVNDKKLNLLGGTNMYAIKTLEVGREAVAGMVLGVPWHIDGDPNSEFPRKSRQLWNANVDSRTAMGYDATQALIAAIKRHPNPTRIDIQKALSAPDFSATAASGTLRFFPSGDRNAPVQLVEVRPANPSRSGTGYDFVPLSRSAPAP